MADTADKPNKKIRRKAPQTVRERSESSNNQKSKRRLVRSTAGRAGSKFLSVGRLFAKILRPLKFILAPFKTRPVRFIGRVVAKILLIKYFRESWHELRKVSWPSRRETWNLTFSVFAFALVFGIVISVVDYGLDKVFKQLILK